MSNKIKIKNTGLDRFKPVRKNCIEGFISSLGTEFITYLNGYDEGKLPKKHLCHITYKSNLFRILREGLKPHMEGCIWLFENGICYDPYYKISYPVRDYIGYNQIFLLENEEAVVFTVDVTNLVEQGMVMGEIVEEPTTMYHRVVRGGISPDKIVSFEFVLGTDHLKNFRHSDNKQQKMLRRLKGKRTINRTLIELTPMSA